MMVGLLAFFLGMKHSFDADHILAVSNFLPQTRSLRETVRLSVSWALGHMVTVTTVTALLYSFRESFLSAFLGHFEKAVPIMLLVIGATALRNVGLFHKHHHQHNGGLHVHRHFHLRQDVERHFHRHLFGIGLIHGLASNDELLALLTISLSLTTLLGLLSGVALFGFGVVAGMVLFGVILSYPLRRFDRDRIRTAASIVAGCLSLGYGLFLIFV